MFSFLINGLTFNGLDLTSFERTRSETMGN